MENARWRGIAKGLGFSLVYYFAYRAAWFNSLDQWFLPAGIRVASMLFLPFRLWPYLFLGDAAALLSIRGPKASQYGDVWAYLSPFLLAPTISLAPILFRVRLKELHENAAWLPVVTLSIAAWSSFCKLALNHVLSGPSVQNASDKFFQYVTGDCLGIMMLAPLIMVWIHRRAESFSPKKLIFDSSIAISMIFVMYLAVLSQQLDTSLRQALLIMMIFPAAGMTFLHGWRGAAIGITATNIAIGAALPEFNSAGAQDHESYIAQQVLVVASAIFLMLGAMISKLYDKARKNGISELLALELAQSSFLSTERNLREKFLYMAQMQFGFDDYRKKLVARLKANGHHEAAMDLNAEGVEQMEWFERHAMALYPIQIEKDGLFAALHADAFTRFWAGTAEVMYFLKGHPKKLSLGLQLAAYRSVCNALALLSEYAPDYYEIRARTWQFSKRRGVTFQVRARPTSLPVCSNASTLAALELEGRVKAYGGAVRRRHRHKITLFLSEDIEGSKDDARALQRSKLLHH